MSKLNKDELHLKVILEYIVENAIKSPDDSIRDMVNEVLLVCGEEIYMDKNNVIIKDD